MSSERRSWRRVEPKMRIGWNQTGPGGWDVLPGHDPVSQCLVRCSGRSWNRDRLLGSLFGKVSYSTGDKVTSVAVLLLRDNGSLIRQAWRTPKASWTSSPLRGSVSRYILNTSVRLSVTTLRMQIPMTSYWSHPHDLGLHPPFGLLRRALYSRLHSCGTPFHSRSMYLPFVRFLFRFHLVFLKVDFSTVLTTKSLSSGIIFKKTLKKTSWYSKDTIFTHLNKSVIKYL